MAGYSAKRLIDKLGIKPGQLAYFRNIPDGYHEALGALPEGVFIAKKLNRPVDFIHCFYTDSASLRKDVTAFRQYLEQNGSLWVSWPKKTSELGKTTDITEQTFRDTFLPHNLVDIKVAAIDDTWSGLKFVWRKH
jgi:hypothetical protein